MSDFTWGGYTASSKNVVVSEYPPIVRSKARVETVQIPGRDGKLTLSEGIAYEPYTKEVKCILLPAATLTAVASWLTGAGYVVFANEPTYKYPARIVEDISFETIVPGNAHRRFGVKFLVQPWKELAATPADTLVTTSGTTVVNAGTLPASPVLLVTGTGTITVTIGVYVFTLTGVSSPLRIDTGAGIVTNAGLTTNYTYMMSGEFPKLISGNNVITWTGTVTSIAITKNQRWI